MQHSTVRRLLAASAPLVTPLVALGFNLALIPLLKFETPFLAFTAAIMLLDQSGRVASWNVGATRITGYGAAEIVGQDLTHFYFPARATPPPQRATFGMGKVLQ